TLRRNFRYCRMSLIEAEVEIPAAAVNTFVELAGDIAKSLNVSNCYICGGTNMGAEGPWLAAEWNVTVPYNRTALNLTEVKDPYSRWPLKYEILADWCVERNSSAEKCIGHLACKTSTILNMTSNKITYWPNQTRVNETWGTNNILWTKAMRNMLSITYNETWIAPPPGLYWICGKTAISRLTPDWCGSCTLGTVRPAFFMLPLDYGVQLGLPVHAKRRADGSWGYRTPIYILNRLIRLQAVLEIFSNETRQLRNAVFQNRLALDYLLVQKGGLCGKFNLSNCCLEIDDSSQGTSQQNKKSKNKTRKVRRSCLC
uniref:ENR1 protein n=1 Tax=Salvator merianae TaxID=96440 RepID=A0A8D0BSG5_SALMN